MNNVIYPILDYLEKNVSTYLGILGINGIMTDDGNLKILGCQSFMQDSDCAGILELINTDLYHLFESCVIGSFSDEIAYIEQKNSSAVSVVLNCRNVNNSENVIQNLDLVDEDMIISYTNNVHKNRYLEYEANTGAVLVVTSVAGTLSLASKKVYDEIKKVNSKTSLIYGITGSGKTEVYMQLADEVIAKGRQVIVLIPEIALTYQTVLRFYKRFGEYCEKSYFTIITDGIDSELAIDENK